MLAANERREQSRTTHRPTTRSHRQPIGSALSSLPHFAADKLSEDNFVPPPAQEQNNIRWTGVFTKGMEPIRIHHILSLKALEVSHAPVFVRLE